MQLSNNNNNKNDNDDNKIIPRTEVKAEKQPITTMRQQEEIERQTLPVPSMRSYMTVTLPNLSL